MKKLQRKSAVGSSNLQKKKYSRNFWLILRETPEETFGGISDEILEVISEAIHERF